MRDIQVDNSAFKGVSIEKAQSFKDKYLVSDKCLRAIRQHINKNVPSVEKLRKHREVLRKKTQIYQNKYGYFNNVKSKVTSILEKVSRGLLQGYAKVDEDVGNKQVFCLKFAGDGTSVCRNIKVFNFVFSCLNESLKCKSANGHYTLGVFQIEHENENELREVLLELSTEIQNLSFVEIDGNKYKIKKFLAGDLKFLHISMGVSAANGKHPCPWCEISDDQFKNPASYLDFSMIPNQKGARSKIKAVERVYSKFPCFKKNRPDHEKCHLGYTHEPLKFGFQYEDAAVDLLHLFLRVSGTLLAGFRSFLRNLDSISSDDMIMNEEDLKKKKFYFGFVQMIRKTGLPRIVSYYQGIKFKDLTGPEYIKLFENLDWTTFPEPTQKYQDMEKIDIKKKLHIFQQVTYIFLKQYHLFDNLSENYLLNLFIQSEDN